MDQGITNSPAVVAERARIVWLWLRGESARTVSQQTGASLSTVYRWIRRWQEEGTVRTRPFHKLKHSKKMTPWTIKAAQSEKTNTYICEPRIINAAQTEKTTSPIYKLQIINAATTYIFSKTNDDELKSIDPTFWY
ncbi:hypothetical protein Pmani_011581 [Petrolisthes manimaculis]|uniref:Transposase n=1 Tax=Petrolisthes manimaculis TaxID=1843537 RepID=A0AAE1Q265_9EUCA|nr:hypothetical protein Pmani_011581 [Petrolisthes manimaculis]